MKKLLQFDFDGVIINTLDLILETKKDTGREISREDYLKLFYGNVYDNLDNTQNDSGVTEIDKHFFSVYGERLPHLAPVPGMIDLLKELHKNYHLVIVSSTINKPIEEFLQQHNIEDCFDDIYGADVHKSKMTKINMSLEKYNLKPNDSLFITDTVGDIKEARNAEVDSIAVSWGFHDKNTLSSESPLQVVDTVEELADCINQID